MTTENVRQALQTDVEILKRDVEGIQTVLAKLDNAIDKIADVSNGINKILAVHDNTLDTLKTQTIERVTRQDEDIRIVHDRITKHEEEFKDEMARYHDRIEDLFEESNKRLTVLERWKWYIMGTAWGIGFLIATLLQSANLLNFTG